MVRDAKTRAFVRESVIAACPVAPSATASGSPVAVTIDESHAIVSNPDQGKLAYVYLQPPRAVAVSVALESVVAGVPAGAFERPQDQGRLLADVEQIQRFLRVAEGVPDPAEQPLLEQALRRLAAMMEAFDGCVAAGPPDQDDLVIDCAEQANLTSVAEELAALVSGSLPPEPREVIP